jgi:uncharacterized protein (TIGR02118 family)
MIKVIVFITARPGISREAFRDYYETNHVPLVRRLLPTIGRYTRSYLQGPPMWRPDEPAPDFDVVTELWFANQADFDAFAATVRRPEISRQIAADEANFLDSTKTRLHLVDEHIAPETAS